MTYPLAILLMLALSGCGKEPRQPRIEHGFRKERTWYADGTVSRWKHKENIRVIKIGGDGRNVKYGVWISSTAMSEKQMRKMSKVIIYKTGRPK